MLRPEDQKYYHILNPEGNFWMPVHWEQLEPGDRVREFDPTKPGYFEEFTVSQQPVLQIADVVERVGSVQHTYEDSTKDQDDGNEETSS